MDLLISLFEFLRGVGISPSTATLLTGLVAATLAARVASKHRRFNRRGSPIAASATFVLVLGLSWLLAGRLERWIAEERTDLEPRTAGWYSEGGAALLWAKVENTGDDTCNVGARWRFVRADDEGDGIGNAGQTQLLTGCLRPGQLYKPDFGIPASEATHRQVVRLTVCEGFLWAFDRWYLFDPSVDTLLEADAKQRRRIDDRIEQDANERASLRCEDGP